MYLRWLDEGREAPAPAAAAPAATTTADPELAWQRLLSFADRVNRGRS